MFGSSMNEGMILPNGITTHQEKLSIIPFNRPYLITNYCQPENYYCHANTFLSKKVYWGWYSKEYVYISLTQPNMGMRMGIPILSILISFWFHSDLNIIPMSIDSIPFQWAKRKLNCLRVGKNCTRNLKGKTTSNRLPFTWIYNNMHTSCKWQRNTIFNNRSWKKLLQDSFFFLVNNRNVQKSDFASLSP